MIDQELWDYLLHAPRYSETYLIQVGTASPTQVAGSSPRRVHIRMCNPSANPGFVGQLNAPGNLGITFATLNTKPDAEFDIMYNGMAIQQPWFAIVNVAATNFAIWDTVVP